MLFSSKFNKRLSEKGLEPKTTTTSQEIKGVYTDLSRLLRLRHWAKELKLFSRQAARSMLLGETRSRFRGRGMEFEEVRPYQAGDDIRTIDWRVSARTGGTYTKLFCEERERPVHILLDQRNSLFFGSKSQFKSVLAAEIAAAIAWSALAGSDRIGGQIIGDWQERDIRAKRNKQAVLQFIHELHELNHNLPTQAPNAEAPAKSLAYSLEECRRITRPGTAIFIISDFHDFDQAAAKALSNLGRHTDIHLLHIVDPLEQQLPASGMVTISNGDQNLSIKLGQKLSNTYHSELQQKWLYLQESAVRARALLSQADTHQTARHFLNKLYGQ